MDRKTCRELAVKIEAVVREALGDEYQVDERGGKFDAHSVTFKVQIAEKTVSGKALTPERQNFIDYAHRHELGEDALDKTFTDYTGRRFRIVGYKPRARKRPIVCEDLQGKKYVFPVLLVKNRLEWCEREDALAR
jgi:hypothetical protein